MAVAAAPRAVFELKQQVGLVGLGDAEPPSLLLGCLKEGLTSLPSVAAGAGCVYGEIRAGSWVWGHPQAN